jgi:hypothetical protein
MPEPQLEGRPRDDAVPLRFRLSLAFARAVLFGAGDDFEIAAEVQTMTGVHIGWRFASRAHRHLLFELRWRAG